MEINVTTSVCDDGATPETAARRKVGDPVLYLLERGAITRRDMIAAEQIREIMEEVDFGKVRNVDLDAPRVDVSRFPGEITGGIKSQAVREYYRHAFLPWSKEMVEIPVKAGARTLDLDLFRLATLVLTGSPVRLLERRMRVRNGTLTPYFVSAIHGFRDSVKSATRAGKIKSQLLCEMLYLDDDEA